MTLRPRRSSRPPRISFESKAGARPISYPSSDRDRIAIMRLELTLPPEMWFAGFTRRHPELVVEFTNVVPLPDNNSIAEVEVYGPPVDWTSEISLAPDVLEVQRLSVVPNLGRYRVRYHTTPIVSLANELEVMIRYPRTVQNGVLTCETIARISQLRRLLALLSELGAKPRITALRRDSLRSVRLTLTSSQRALFRQALALGYFEVPRRISLTRLAEKVSRSKSSVSEMLAVVERKLAHSAILAEA
jgi:hypothetical protein